jgi:hypothetical protein
MSQNVSILNNSSLANNGSQYIPWSWVITPLNTTSPGTTCPSYHSILGTFAAVNALMLLSPLIIGNGRIISRITCEKWGSEDPGDGKPWQWSWMISFTLQLVSNAIIAGLMKHVSGYKATFSIGDLVLFYTVRPRLSWMFLSIIATAPGYWDSFMSNMICEFFLQCVAMGYMAKTVHFASKHHYLLPAGSDGIHNVPKVIQDLPAGALLMYAGAMVYVVFFAIFILVIIFNIAMVIKLDAPDSLELSKFTCLGIMLAFPLAFTWAGSWMFWAGYIKIAGDL